VRRREFITLLGAAAVCELEHSQIKQIFDGLLGDDIEARLRKTGRVSVYCATARAFTSAGWRSPLGPRGTIYGLALAGLE
jgi:hypothetical protein